MVYATVSDKIVSHKLYHIADNEEAVAVHFG